MSLIIMGTNHNYSPIEFRERIYFSKKGSRDGLDFLKERGILKGAVILSTCNRVEIYSISDDEEKAIEEIKNFISRYHEIDLSKLSPYFYIYKGKDAAMHLFSVACGLESLVVGESQILEQVRLSLMESENAGFIDRSLKGVFDLSISFADSVHRTNNIFSGDISIGSIVMSFLKERFGGLRGKNILIMGTGMVIELILRHLEKERPEILIIANRTFDRAKGLASQIKAKAVRFSELKKFLNNADVIITATRSPHFIIKKDMLKGVAANKILILDLALPRDVDPEVKDIKNVELFYLEDLRPVIEKNVSGRALQAEGLKEMIGIEVGKLCKEYIGLEPEPALLP
jgi:glutamyl-tRNA reductase